MRPGYRRTRSWWRRWHPAWWREPPRTGPPRDDVVLVLVQVLIVLLALTLVVWTLDGLVP